MSKAVVSGFGSKLKAIFRTREFMHYHDERGMRVIKVTGRQQVLGATMAAALLGYTGLATGMIATGGENIELTAELAHTKAELAQTRAKVASIQNDVAMQTARMEKRQAFLSDLFAGEADLNQLATIMPREGGSESAAAGISLLTPFTKLEAEQLAFVDQAASAAEARYRDRSAQLRKMGLRPDRFLKQSTIAMGGPDIPADVSGSPLAGAEPRFKQLFMSWKKLDLLEKELSAVPSIKPVKSYTYTSSYGIRFDPFKGTTAMHQGVDMSGPVGEPIYAAADGVVTKSGRHGGYGKLVEIDHGKGMTTRYAHMSRLNVKIGDHISAGEQIGGMGSTGRSTGSHLHYEVRIDGRAVNPMPFLEAADMAMNTGAKLAGGE
ncbi:MAG: peptidoglycan DD-metalloendopeptidase family protein [Pacificimonas sp.]